MRLQIKKVCMVIRADAPGDSEVGVGHVMRCIALAEAWIRTGGAKAVLLTANCLPWVAKAANDAGIDVAPMLMAPGEVWSESDAKYLAEFAVGCNADWVVVDGYRFGVEYFKTLSSGGDFRVMAVDDYGHCSRYDVDIVLNESGSSAFEKGPHTLVLQGFEYALVRREFYEARLRRESHYSDERSVFVGMGGSNAMGLAEEISDRLRNAGFVPFLADSTCSIARQMEHAGMGVVNGGMTAIEALGVGLPLIVVPVADNQIEPANFFRRMGAARCVDPSCLDQIGQEAMNLSLYSAGMIRAGKSLIDCCGAGRVVSAMLLRASCEAL